MPPRRKPSPEARALVELMVEVAAVFFRMRETGKKSGAVTRWGGGMWGLLRTLALEGPKTVPAIARSRPVARQRIQTLADAAAAAGFVEFVDNPAHKRSKRVRLTATGEAHFRALTQRLESQAETVGRDLKAGDIRTATALLRTLRDRLAGGG